MDPKKNTGNETLEDNDGSRKFNILYVDDEQANLRIFNYSFGKDYNVFLASSGVDAIKILDSEEIDLIVSDQRMPRMTGVELLKKIVPKYPNIIRMIITGFSDIGVIVEAVNAIGLHKYIQKPWDRAQLKAVFEEELNKKAAKEAGQEENERAEDTDTRSSDGNYTPFERQEVLGQGKYLGTVKFDPLETTKPAGAGRLESIGQQQIMLGLGARKYPDYDQVKINYLLRGAKHYVEEQANISIIAYQIKPNKKVMMIANNTDGTLSSLEFTGSQFELLIKRAIQLLKQPASAGFSKVQKFNDKLTIEIKTRSAKNPAGEEAKSQNVVLWFDHINDHEVGTSLWNHMIEKYKQFADLPSRKTEKSPARREDTVKVDGPGNQ